MIYYKSLFTKIVNQRIKNIELELYFLNKLKFMIDRNTAKKLIDLMKDYKQTSVYAEMITLPENSQMKLTTNIFTNIEMEMLMNCQVTLPKVMNDIVDQFERLFLSRNEGKKLTFIPLYSYCLVSYKSRIIENGKRKKFMLYLNTIQYSILDQFVQNETITMDKLNQLTPNREIITKMVQLLVDNDIITRKENVLELNNSFNPIKKVTNCLVSVKSKINRVEEKQETIEEHIEHYKGNKMLCSIMKIMKQKKFILFADLVTEIKEQLSSYFTVDTHFVKKNLEYLINKELIERDTTNPNQLKYNSQ